MDIFDILNLIGGIALFLFGMNIMSKSLEKIAGSSLKMFIAKFTTNKFAGLLTGLAVTAVMQSSSATTVMVVGFANSGLMTLSQCISVIMGANIGTTVTAWILSLSGIEGTNIFMQLLQPSSFTPVLALIGIILYLTGHSERRRETGYMLLGFATLMTGMLTMSSSVSGLKDVPEFTSLFILFKNPFLGVIAGALLCAIVQSSAGSVGMLQAIVTTGAVSYGAAIPIIMGQNIGTCMHAMFSSVGTNKNAHRAALVHLMFNVIGTLVYLVIFCIVSLLFHPVFFDQTADIFGIAVVHSLFNICCVVLLFPFSGLLEKLVCRMVPDSDEPDTVEKLDERLLANPVIALGQCKSQVDKMASAAFSAMSEAMKAIADYSDERIHFVKTQEDMTDRYEDSVYDFLIKLSSLDLGRILSAKAAEYMKLVGDFERLADHALNVAESAVEMHEKKIVFSDEAACDLAVLFAAVNEIMDLAYSAFSKQDIETAVCVEPLEQNIDILKEEIRSRHIARQQSGACSVESGFVLNDILTNTERAADHCSNVALCIIENRVNRLDMHGALKEITKQTNVIYHDKLLEYRQKYHLE